MTQDLAQMGSARVEVIHWCGVPAIRKSPCTAVEGHFYRSIRPQLRVSAPQLLASEGRALILERLPRLASRNEWAEPALRQSLAQLHQNHLPGKPESLFTFPWQDEVLLSAINHFPLEQHPRLRQAIRPYLKWREPLLEPLVPISGDSNIGNWGQRTSGEWVLFDWERFSLGSPAIDLAPLMVGFPEFTEVHDFVGGYLHHAKDCVLSQDQLACQVIAANAIITLEVVSLLHHRNNPQTNRYMAWFEQAFLPWLERHYVLMS